VVSALRDPAAERRLRRLRRGASLAVILLATAGGALAGGAVAALSVLTILGVLLGRRVGRPSVRAAARWRVINTSVLVSCLLLLFAGLPPVTIGVALVGALQIHRAFSGRSAADDRTALLLALLQALLGCILSTSILLAPLFLALSLLAPVALALCHIDGEVQAAHDAQVVAGGTLAPPRLMWLLGPAAAVLTLVFFVVLPRLQGAPALLSETPQRVTGFGDDVDLGDLGPMLESDALVMRVRVTDAAGQPWSGPLYMRGAALDSFDGERWTSSAGAGGRWEPPRDAPMAWIRQEVMLEPLSEQAIFGLNEVVRVTGVGRRLVRDANGVLRFEGEPGRLEYTVFSRIPTRDPAVLRSIRPAPRAGARSRGELAAADAGTWLQLPVDLDPRVRQLAARYAAAVGPSASAWEQAQAISAALQRDYAYTLTPTVADEPIADPLAWFLFDSRQGHCEFFATALAVMLRTRGIPARVVNGFLGGELNPLGDQVLVRQRDAHAWVEVNMGEEGWVTLDATPAVDREVTETALWTQVTDWLDRRWEQSVLQYELGDQLAGLSALGEAVALPRQATIGALPLPAIAGLFAVLGGGLLLVVAGRGLLRFLARVPRPPRHRGRVEALHARAWRRVHARGWQPPAALPPVAAAEWVVAHAGTAAEPLLTLSWLRYRVRYGGAQDDALASAARDALDALRAAELPTKPAPADSGTSD